MLKRPLLATIVFLSIGGLQAQTTRPPVYRCGSTYSNAPCEGAVAVNVDDARSAAQKAASEKAIARDQQLAAAMEKARLEQEKEVVARDVALRRDKEKQAKTLAAKQKLSRAPRLAAEADKKSQPIHLKKPATNKPKKPDDFIAKVGDTPSK